MDLNIIDINDVSVGESPMGSPSPSVSPASSMSLSEHSRFGSPPESPSSSYASTSNNEEDMSEDDGMGRDRWTRATGETTIPKKKKQLI